MQIRNFLKSILPHKRNDDNHYGKFLGSFNFFRILSWNIFHPTRMINRIRWNMFFNYSKTKQKKYKKFISSNRLEKNKLSDKLGKLINDGGLIVQEYFDNQKIENFLNEYNHLIEKEKKHIENNLNENSKFINNFYAYRVINLHLSKALIDIWLDENVTQFLEHYLGRKIYAREYPRLVFTKYFYDEELTTRNEYLGKYKNSNVKVPYFWHTDHSAGLISLHILLADLDLSNTHMQYLPGSNQYLNSRDLYSDQTVGSFKNQPVNCIGKKGTIYFHTGNTLHRVVGRKNSSRLGLILSFSPGSGVEMDCERIAGAFANDFRIENLTKRQREILRGIYPEKGNYEFIKNNLKNPTFDERLN
tara:strand:- start:63 stop:1142 length:1080 start_codon:yes stop_codon:yes gene_type:complete